MDAQERNDFEFEIAGLIKIGEVDAERLRNLFEDDMGHLERFERDEAAVIIEQVVAFPSHAGVLLADALFKLADTDKRLEETANELEKARAGQSELFEEIKFLKENRAALDNEIKAVKAAMEEQEAVVEMYRAQLTSLRDAIQATRRANELLISNDQRAIVDAQLMVLYELADELISDE